MSLFEPTFPLFRPKILRYPLVEVIEELEHRMVQKDVEITGRDRSAGFGMAKISIIAVFAVFLPFSALILPVFHSVLVAH
jgi:hypothetical protein